MAAGSGSLGRLLGHRFGDWIVMSVADVPNRREIYYLCRCSCGFEKPVAKSSLLNGMSTRCRKCSNANNKKAHIARRRPIESGTVVGLWTVLGEAEARGGDLYMRCRCECGAEHEVMATALRTGKSKSCAECARKMTIAKKRELSAEHGGVSPEYRAWSRMNERCRSPKAKSYGQYGGRGITVCNEWQGEGGFQAFIDHIGPRPSENHSLDRIDNEKGYEPGNVRWATKKQQQRNTRKNRLVTVRGETKCAAAWADESPVSAATIRKRLDMGWSGEDAVFTESRRA